MTKKIFLFLLFFTTHFIIKSQNNQLLASCCETSEARCTGSASCTACKNCSRCAHCNSGGSCGVCSSTQSKPARTKKSTSVNKTSLSPSSSPDVYFYHKDELLVANKSNVNVRSGAGTHYDIIEKLKINDEVLFIQQSGQWIKVTVKKSKKTGWVYAKNLKRKPKPSTTAKAILQKNWKT